MLVVHPEKRLADVSQEISQCKITHCVIVEKPSGRFDGLVRLTDIASSSSERIFADLVSSRELIEVAEDADFAEVASFFPSADREEIGVISFAGRFLGLITTESLLQWSIEERAKGLNADRPTKENKSIEVLVHEKVEKHTAELRAALEDARNYAAFASHDLRAPVRAIQSYVAILSLNHRTKLDADGAFILDRLVNAVDQMHVTLEAFLDEGAISSLSPDAIVNIDLQEIMKDACVRCETLIAERSAEIKLGSTVHSFRARHSLIVQIVTNLLSNAIKYVPKSRKPKIKIETQLDGSDVVIRFYDNGRGIRKDLLPRLFRVYERLEASPEVDGKGLGLKIVQRAAKRLGGVLSIDSSSEYGSTFSIRLPRIPPPELGRSQ
ncbi:MAG TPA: HAMP domain-containing sensor histidine kinase [Opitutaceae bacterium]|nr:HAMP domain-containing sensor histidine kinase [Opitutaceae bacterium]